MSTVVLPISPVEGAPESDNESDWGSDFDESVHDDQYDNDGELYEIIGDMSKSTTSNVSCVFSQQCTEKKGRDGNFRCLV